MIVTRKWLVPASAVLMATLGVTASLYALSCMYPAEVDVWELEFVAVTADGDLVEDPDEYGDFEFRIESHPSGVRLVGDAIGSADEYELVLIPDELPEEFEEYGQEQGGTP